MGRKHTLIGLVIVAIVGATLALPSSPMAAGAGERLANGGFEEGFYQAAAGYVGNGWNWFSTGGETAYGFYDDTWEPVVQAGVHSQLIEINTYKAGAPEPDRYAGIYQTVAVVPGETYQLTLCGMLRALEDDPDRGNYSYRVQYGIDPDGGTNWQTVANWVEVPWDSVHPRQSPGTIASFSAAVTATGDRLTLFVRAWKKWGTAGRELDMNLDSISLKGANPTPSAAANGGETFSVVQTGGAGYTVVETSVGGFRPPLVSFEVPAFPTAGWDYAIPVRSSHSVGVTRLELYDNGVLVDRVAFEVGLLDLAHDFAWTPGSAGEHVLKALAYNHEGGAGSFTAEIMVGENAQFVRNGDFEGGFEAGPMGAVGANWGSFASAGGAGYGFYDDSWAPVVDDGSHSQLIEINTLGPGKAEANRYAGIYQVINWLTTGANYRLSMSGLLRALTSDPDRVGYSYRVEWGILPGGGTDWTAVTNWSEVAWDDVSERLDPNQMSSFSTTFVAPSSKVTLFIRAWKKWATPGVELDVNLDAISVMGYK